MIYNAGFNISSKNQLDLKLKLVILSTCVIVGASLGTLLAMIFLYVPSDNLILLPAPSVMLVIVLILAESLSISDFKYPNEGITYSTVFFGSFGSVSINFTLSSDEETALLILSMVSRLLPVITIACSK